MEFVSFTDLENTYRQSTIDKIVCEMRDSGDWIVTEKIHGANGSFWCDGSEVRLGSRTQFVDGTFFSCQAVINKYENNILNYHKKHLQPGVLLVIYGELYGKGIQKEVNYGEKNFRSFAVHIDGVPQDWSTVTSVSRALGIDTAPVLSVTSFKEALSYPNTFRSVLTPEGFEGDNFAEGVSIAPATPKRLSNGSRIWLKNKSPAFSECKVRTPKQVMELTETESNLLADLLCYNTAQRVSNVLSKFGAVTNRDFGKVLGLTVQDILKDFAGDTGRDVKVEAEQNYKRFVKEFEKEVGVTIREQFVKLLED